MHTCFPRRLRNALSPQLKSAGIRGKMHRLLRSRRKTVKKVTERPLSPQQDYLRRFYPSDSETREADSFEARLKRMQTFFRLPVTGVLNSRVIEIMQRPRCGVPDVADYSLFPTRPKWNSRVVTYRCVRGSPRRTQPSPPKAKRCFLVRRQGRVVHARPAAGDRESTRGKGFGLVEQGDPAGLQESVSGDGGHHDWLCERR